jgi:hypothetical protein
MTDTIKDPENEKQFDKWMNLRNKVHKINLSDLTVGDLELILEFLGVHFECGPHHLGGAKEVLNNLKENKK